MEDFFFRLDKYMKYKGLNDHQLTVNAQLSQGLLSTQRKKRGTLSSDNVAKILRVCSDLNAEWLLLGTGKMLKEAEETPQEDMNSTTSENPQSIIASLTKTNAILAETNRQLSETITTLVNKKIPDVPREDGVAFAGVK